MSTPTAASNDRHSSHAYRVARSVCGDAHRSEEAVQDGFLAVWRGRSRFRSASGSFQAWSMTLVRYAAIDILRREGADRRPPLSAPRDDAPDQRSVSPEHRAVAHDEAAALGGALARLPAAQAAAPCLAGFLEDVRGKRRRDEHEPCSARTSRSLCRSAAQRGGQDRSELVATKRKKVAKRQAADDLRIRRRRRRRRR
ncbi:MAG: RNA polymerase sigma factor [Solirubrobacterales bacterium]